MTNDPDTAPADVNERVESEWSDETTPFERVRAVMKRTYESRSANEIATRARTTPTTARKHLQQLDESGFVETVSEPQRDATLYRRSSESLVLEQARDILDRADDETLLTRIGEMQDDIRAYREKSGVDSPEDAALLDADVDRSTLRDWRTTRRNLGFAKVALALSEAEAAVRTTPTA